MEKGGQTKGWINLKDSLRCIEHACTHPADAGEFRVFNQFTEQFSVQALAERVLGLCGGVISSTPNPRIEAESHYYNAKHTALEGLGLVPTLLTDDILGELIADVESAKDRINPALFEPTIKWDGGG